MTAAEFLWWDRVYAAEPWGCAADDARLMFLAAVITAGKGGQMNPADYLPRWFEQGKPPADELSAADGVKALAALLRGESHGR